MLIVVVRNLAVGDMSVEQLIYYLLLISVSEKAVFILLHLLIKIVSHIFLGLTKYHRLPDPLVNIVLHNSHAVFLTNTFAHKTGQIALVQFVFIGTSHHRRLFGIAVAGSGQQRESQQTNKQSSGPHPSLSSRCISYAVRAQGSAPLHSAMH